MQRDAADEPACAQLPVEMRAALAGARILSVLAMQSFVALFSLVGDRALVLVLNLM